MPRVSVIIPVYNAEHWLRCCLNALCGQTLRDIEIICVNDGSSDNSPAILNEYAAKDSRFCLVTLSENMGAATARNRGMAVAKGEYLGFVDSDDHPALDFYEKLYTRASETRADVVKGNYKYWGLDGKSWPVDYSMNESILEYKTSFSFAFCSAIYQRQLVVDHAITFPEDQIDIEDPIFSLKIALLYDTIEIVDDAEINIRIHKGSTTFGPPSIKRILAKFKGLSGILDLINNNEMLEKHSYAFITAFWFKSVFETSLQNKTIQAYRLIVSSLYEVFRKVKHHEQCAIEFNKLYLSDLFTALISWKITRLAAYIVTFYDSKMLMARELRFRVQKKIYEKAKGACVAIPIYVDQLAFTEIASLRQCLKMLGGQHRIVFLGPESLSTISYEKIAQEYGVSWTFEKFEDAYFESTISYSKLLLSIDFYSRFIHSEYLLIYQLDSWVFRDELIMWCNKGYAYIGAPWFEGYSEAKPDSQILSPSGNGGFSLRKVRSFIECLHTLEDKMIAGDLDVGNVDAILSNQHEDYIVVNLFPKVMAEFMIAPKEDAMRFSFEMFPERLLALTGKLPFGCHAYEKYSPDFWAGFITAQEHSGSDVHH